MRLLNLKTNARAEALASLTRITDAAADANDGAGRDLTDAEDTNCRELRESIDRLDKQIEVLQADAKRAEGAPKVNARTEDTPTPRPADAPDKAEVKGDNPWTNIREASPYGDGHNGTAQFLADLLATTPGLQHHSSVPTNLRETEERMNKWKKAISEAESGDINSRAVAISDLGGIVIPQFDPSMISRGIYDDGVTTMLLNRFAMFSSGDSITIPRVTTQAAAAIHAENAAAHDTKVVTTGVKADLFTVAAKIPVSVQAIERGTMPVELLQDELRSAWMEKLNELVLWGDGSTGDEPSGLLNQVAGRAGQFINKADASPTSAKQLAYLTEAKTAIWKADRRRVDAYVVGPDVVGRWEVARTSNGDLLIPPYPGWVQNQGGAGTLPEAEGPMSEMTWGKIPIFVDPAIDQTIKADGSAVTGGTETRFIAMCRRKMPIWFDGPMSYAFEQTLAENLQVLLVVRGYCFFNPVWRPEAWRVVRGTGTALPAVASDQVDVDEDED